MQISNCCDFRIKLRDCPNRDFIITLCQKVSSSAKKLYYESKIYESFNSEV